MQGKKEPAISDSFSVYILHLLTFLVKFYIKKGKYEIKDTHSKFLMIIIHHTGIDNKHVKI